MSKIKKILSLCFAVMLIASVCATAVSADEYGYYDDEGNYIPYDTEESYTDDTNYDDSYTDDNNYDENYTDDNNYDENYTEDTSYEESSADETSATSDTESSTVDSTTDGAAAALLENNGSRAESSTDSAVPAADTETASSEITDNYVTIGQTGIKENSIAQNGNILGIILIAAGVVGIICVIVWSVSTKKIKRESDDYIYETVGAAARNDEPKKQRDPRDYGDNYGYSRRSQPERAPQRPSREDLEHFSTRNERPQRSENPQPRHSQQSSQSSRTAPSPRSAQSRPQTRPQSSAKTSKYDTDEILMDILGKNKDK